MNDAEISRSDALTAIHETMDNRERMGPIDKQRARVSHAAHGPE